MKKEEKKYYLDLLEKEKEKILKNLSYAREVIEKGEKGVPTHIADYGTDEFEKDLEVGLSNSERKILVEIDLAIKKIKEGTYGKCDNCKQPISKERLKALPYARFCIKCQTEREKSGKK
ncbi:MAG: TraR/DksA family transcriptional regulator [Candidatus Omnitrophica bacterium]|nr:TraR/DksA family transcriptional regulator [Candidatus Omnitrophota bacterium]MCM8801842.1 TraR/DksA family transcriptional regulator [Candidatus Omnitrophota bacterium]